MRPKTPTLEQLASIADEYRLHLSEGELDQFRALMPTTLGSYERIDQLEQPLPNVRYPRQPGYRPAPSENPLGAWYWRCSIKGADTGPLKGKRLAIKDNVCVAGVPMMNGASVLEGYVPEIDATIVSRILDAGGEIVGKAVCEHLCFSGSSFTSDTGPVHNPHDPTRSAGGSSSGSAALVAAGEVEMAIGCDQGGSIRIPSSWSGAYGLKPTYGLVPYTGVFPIELTLDHAGPIAGTVADVAGLLQVIAGEDQLDPRQRGVKTANYRDALTGDLKGLRVGIVPEGFEWPGVSEADVDDAVREAAAALGRLGAQVRELSVPMHREGIHIWNGIAIEGATMLMVRGNSMGTNWKGLYNVSLLDAYARGRLTRADDLSDTVKLILLLGQYLQDSYHGHYYAKAQNLARALTRAYDEALEQVDVLLMPTIPMKATPLPGPDTGFAERIVLAIGMIFNTCPFDVSGHPAMSVPCAVSGNLPIGMMLIGRYWEEATVLRLAHTFEQTGAYTPKARPVAVAGRSR
ncbi:MAG: amidase [Chloroflexi bacterium]|nr:MAG: amidase [Chloroflexota bacterium]TMF36900.1 MAG: amidase [Chloroflexota bacterium]